MGGLLSIFQDEPRPPPVRHSDFYTYTPPVTNYRLEVSHPRLSTQYNSGSVSNNRLTTTSTARTSSLPTNSYSSHFSKPSNQVTHRPRVVQNAVSKLPLLPSVYDDQDAEEWDMGPLPHGTSFRLVNVFEYEDDFSIVKTAFQNGAKRKGFKIVKIERVENPFLLGYYLLKKEEMERNHFVSEVNLFHGTKKCNINNICENNFNWRLYGDSTGSRYGKGVSFSPISYYASHYSDKTNTNKIMFYVKVLVGNSIVGNENMVLPPKLRSNSNTRYDTAKKQDGHVIVKFGDNEFYPEFIIHYCSQSSAANHHQYASNSYQYYDSDDSVDYY